MIENAYDHCLIVWHSLSCVHTFHEIPHSILSALSIEIPNTDGHCISVPQQGLCGATRWRLLLLCGVAVQQAGWWSLYGDFGLWCALIGGALALAGAVGFDRDPGHAARVPSTHDWWTRPYTADERREIDREIRERNERGGCCHTHEPDLPADAKKEGLRGQFWFGLFDYALLGALTTGISAAWCPATGTVPASGNPGNDTWVPPAEATPDAAGREYGWGDRAEANHGEIDSRYVWEFERGVILGERGGCRFGTVMLALFSLPFQARRSSGG